MNIYTLNVGQGQFVVVAGAREAFIIDTHIALTPATPIINVKGALASILNGKDLVGLIVTGFDSDHFNEVGLRLVLNKYRPRWLMYPRYFKNTATADTCFGIISQHDTADAIQRVSVSLGDNNKRFYGTLAQEFGLELFSPHTEDMTSSNNCSLVCKVTDNLSGRTYLLTGDTEIERWNRIVAIFGSALKCDVLAAGHHGSKNGTTRALMNVAAPHTVLVSAGVNNQYGHPDSEALGTFQLAGANVYCTNYGVGQSLRTEATAAGVATYVFTV